MCWATSATIVWLWPYTVMSNSRAKLISGRASGGNSTSTTGPAMETTRPSFVAVAAPVSVRVVSAMARRLLFFLGGLAELRAHRKKVLQLLKAIKREFKARRSIFASPDVAAGRLDTEPALRPIRNIMPNLGGIDISPVILIILLLFLQRIIYWLYVQLFA